MIASRVPAMVVDRAVVPWGLLCRFLSSSLEPNCSPLPHQLPPPYAKKVKDVDEVFLPPGTDVADAKRLRKLAFSNIFVGSHVGRYLVVNAEYVRSSTSESDCPRDGMPEFAVVGRSNVGKSSLVNSLVRKKRLAKTSKAPGKTQVINHYLINKSWYLVDLPGYGYAEAPTHVRRDWNAFTKDYFLQRKTLVSVLLLMDGSLPPKGIDFAYADWLRSKKIPLTIVFTKCDKRKKKKKRKNPEDNVREFENKVKAYFSKVPPWIMTSCKTTQGREELLIHLSELRNYWRT